MAISIAFNIATNQAGESLGTFIEYKLIEGSAIAKDKDGNEILDPKTGEVKLREWQLFNLIFNVKGKQKGTYQKVTLSTNGKISEGTILDTALKNMGWLNKFSEVILDEDGLEISVTEASEQDIESEIKLFLDSVKNCDFWLKVAKNAKGYLTIDPHTIRAK